MQPTGKRARGALTTIFVLCLPFLYLAGDAPIAMAQSAAKFAAT
jgi:hypothetical protein